MKNTGKVIIGLCLITAGVLWILNILGVLPFTFSTKGWWALFVIIPSLCALFSDQKDKVGPCIGIGVGVLLLLAARDVITWNMMWQIGVAVMIIGFGLQLLLFKWNGFSTPVEECNFTTINRDGKNIRRVQTSFGRQDLSFNGEKFEGADVETSFGALTLNLKGAEIVDQAFINLNVGFAGVTIIVPEGLAVQTSVNSGFGGLADHRYTKVSSGTPLLIITGKIGFGGVEIRN